MEKKDKSADNQQMEVSGSTGMMMTTFFAVFSLAFLFPIFPVSMNVFKSKLHISDTSLQFPAAEVCVGLGNYTEGVGKMGFFTAPGRSLLITVCSVTVIVLFTSMTAWYITRIKTKPYSVLYRVFVFAMIVPLQMVMSIMSKTVNDLYLNSTYGLILLCLGSGAGQAVFLFYEFVKVILLGIKEVAMIGGCSSVQTHFHVVFPMLRPTTVTVAILNTMWIWNGYLLPSLVLPQGKDTVPMAIQNPKGGCDSTDMGAVMAMLVLAIVPIIIFYLSCQKYVIKGVAADVVKG